MTVRPSPEHLVHRNAADPGLTRSPVAPAQIGRAFVNLQAFQVGIQSPLLQEQNICVIRSTAVIEPAIQPPSYGNIESTHQFALGVVGIHDPRCANLASVAHAGNSLRPGFGPTQRREQHGGQYGDNGDNHQKFDQSETLPPVSKANQTAVAFQFHNEAMKSPRICA
jgi:hypothetical protein